MKDVVLILGYNNTRVDDVKKIQSKVYNLLGALTILCKPAPSETDQSIVDDIIDVNLENDVVNLEKVLITVREKNYNIIGVLPFSDIGTQLGALITSHLGLIGADNYKIKAALDKSIFRQEENLSNNLPDGYKKILHKRIESKHELINIFNAMKGNIFIKPVKEGNSRGCISINQNSDLDLIWEQLLPYKDNGILIEEKITDLQEYSWDHVAGFNWITEKETTKNDYRAEIQQIVPAPLSEIASHTISEAGEFIANISGSNGSACHNEIFYDHLNNITKAVEPNLRPAGMQIWTLASLAYENFDPWDEWIRWASKKHDEAFKPLLKHNYYAGIRMIKAQKKGTLVQLPEISPHLHTNDVEFIECKWSKNTGDRVSNTVADNSGFIGYIIARAKNYEHLKAYLLNTVNYIEKQITINEA